MSHINLFCDIDGVVCDLVGGFLDYISFKAHKTFYPWSITQYDMAVALAATGEISRDEAGELLSEFLDSPSLISALDAISPICRAIRQLIDENQEVTFITCRTGNCYSVTHEWMLRNSLSGMLLSHTEEDKAKLVAESRTVLLEDNPNLIAKIEQCEQLPMGVLCLVEQPWNQGHKMHEPLWVQRVMPVDAPYSVYTRIKQAINSLR